MGRNSTSRLTCAVLGATIVPTTSGAMQRRPSAAVRFCNNPACERCDLHLRPGEILRKDGREVCPACHEDLVIQERRIRAVRSSGRPRR